VQAERKNFSALKTWLEQILVIFNIAESDMKKILIASDEIFTNISTHGYPDSAQDKPIEIYIDYDAGKHVITIKFRDYGVAFNPTISTSEEAKSRVKNHIAGGLGLFLVERLMDNMDYARLDCCNEITITKALTVKE